MVHISVKSAVNWSIIAGVWWSVDTLSFLESSWYRWEVDGLDVSVRTASGRRTGVGEGPGPNVHRQDVAWVCSRSPGLEGCSLGRPDSFDAGRAETFPPNDLSTLMVSQGPLDSWRQGGRDESSTVTPDYVDKVLGCNVASDVTDTCPVPLMMSILFRHRPSLSNPGS